MIATLSALAASLSWGSSDFLAGLNARRASLLYVVAVSQLAGLAAAALLVLVVLRQPWPGLSVVWPVLLGGVADALATSAFFKGLALGKMSVVASIAASSALIPFVVGLAEGEQLTVPQMVALSMVVIGTILAAGKSSPTEEMHHAAQSSERQPEIGASFVATTAISSGAVDTTSGGCESGSMPGTGKASIATSAGWPPERLAIALALLTAACAGLTLLTYNSVARYDPTWAMLAGRAATAACVGIYLVARRQRPAASRAVLPGVIVAGMLQTAAWGLFAFASARGHLSVVAVLGNTYPVVTAVLAYALLHERLSRGQLGGVSSTLIGVALLTLV